MLNEPAIPVLAMFMLSLTHSLRHEVWLPTYVSKFLIQSDARELS